MTYKVSRVRQVSAGSAYVGCTVMGWNVEGLDVMVVDLDGGLVDTCKSVLFLTAERWRGGTYHQEEGPWTCQW